jgi:predicted O-methyltransferase YrrM
VRRTVLGRVTSLASVLRRDPAEFADRITTIVEGRLAGMVRRSVGYEAGSWDGLVAQLGTVLGPAFESALQEAALSAHEAEVGSRLATRISQGIDPRHDGDPVLARCCYAIVRTLRPAIVLETGVAHGVTSAYILAALDVNGDGALHSIDLPPHDTGAEASVGVLVAPELRRRWHLHRGMSRRLLAPLLRELGTIDVFVHDSLHTYRNMRMEFAEAVSHLRQGGAIIADDIEGNAAFLELRRLRPTFWAACRQSEKPGLFGVVLR